MAAISILRPDISWCQCCHTTENASVSQGWDPAASFQGHVPRPAAHVGIILQTAPSHGNWEPRMEMQDGRWAQGHVSHIWMCLHHWALSSILSNPVRKTQKCIRESVLPHQALRCYPCWISSTAHRTAGKRHLLAPEEMLGKRKCFHVPSCLWDVGYCPSLGRIQALGDFPTVSALKQNERNKQIIMYSFCILLNPNLTNLITRLRSPFVVDILQGMRGPLSCVTQSTQHVFRLVPGPTGAFLSEILLECLYEAKFAPFSFQPLNAVASLWLYKLISKLPFHFLPFSLSPSH